MLSGICRANFKNKKYSRGFAAYTFGTGIAHGVLPGLLLVQEMFAGFCRMYFYYRKYSRGFAACTFGTRNAHGVLPDVFPKPEVGYGVSLKYLPFFFLTKKCIEKAVFVPKQRKMDRRGLLR